MKKNSKLRSKLVSLGLTVGLAISSCAMVFANPINLKDTNNHWAKGYIEKLINRGNIKGYPDATFKPNGTITNAEFTKILVSSLGYKDLGNANEDHWASNYIEKAESLGIINKSDFTNKEDQNINRGKMAEMIVKALGKEDEINKNVQTIFEDDSNISQELKGYIDYASRTEILNGYPVDKVFLNKDISVQVLEFRTNKPLTRGETAKVIDRVMYVRENNIKPKEIINVSEKFASCKVQFQQPIFIKEGIKDLDTTIGENLMKTDELQMKIHGYEWRKYSDWGLPGKNIPTYALVLDIEYINNTEKKYKMLRQGEKIGYAPAIFLSTVFETTKEDFGNEYKAGEISVFYEPSWIADHSKQSTALQRSIPPKSSIRGKYVFNIVDTDIIPEKTKIVTYLDDGNPNLRANIPIQPLNNDNYVDEYPEGH